MKNIINKHIAKLMTGFLALGLIAFTGCDATTETTPETGTMQVKMHDAPGDYDEVNVHISRVEVNRSEGDSGWMVISEPNETYNLLELINGEFEVLANAELETGTYQQIRLIVDDSMNSIVIDGNSFPLTVPSGAQTGLKLNINAEIEAGITYVLLLDFDADRSVNKRGVQDQYNLTPVIRATSEAVTGNIGGVVEPIAARAAVYAIADSDTLSTTFANSETGEFLLVGLEAGLYDLSFEAREDGYTSAGLNDVEVVIGSTTEVGTVVLEEEEQE